MANKGPPYERLICKMLSLWWSIGEHDDLLWRTAGSGGRAKTRGKKGKRTHGHHGDICATHPSAEPLIKCLTIEIKRGYSKFTFADVIDKKVGAAQQEWESWLAQTLASYVQSGSLSWILIQRRDQRQAVVFFPNWLLRKLKQVHAFIQPPPTFCSFRFVAKDKVTHHLHCMLLEDFLGYFCPQDIRNILAL